MQLATEIVTYSHSLKKDCFAFFSRHDAGLHVTPTSATSFTLLVDGERFKKLGSRDVIFHAHISASCYIVALNIVSLGYFSWRDSPTLHPIYVVRDPDSPELSAQVALLQQQSQWDIGPPRELSEIDVQKSILIYGALLRDEDRNSLTEYVKALLHMGAFHLDITFYREAFSNFYRCVESFVTRRILCVSRLSNEVKDIQKALKLIGADEELASIFKEVYAIRSSQVAHAQIRQRDISFDDVLKVKFFADVVMYKTYRQQADEWRSAQNGTGTPRST